VSEARCDRQIETPRPSTSRRRESLALLGDKAFRRLWLCGAINGTMRWLEALAVSVFVFDLTDSSLDVALVLFARWVPLVLFGAWFGVVVDRFDRKIILTVGYIVVALVSTALGVLVVTGAVELWHIALGAFLNGTFAATDYPARRTLVGEVAGQSRLGVAMALDSSTNNGTRMLGPAIGGLLLEAVGLEGVYILGTVLYVAGLSLIAGLHRRPTAEPTAPATQVIVNLLDGFRFIRTQPLVLGTLAVTVIVNMFGFPFTTLVPVIGRDELALSAFPVGLLASAEGCGSLTGALIIAATVKPHLYRRLYLVGSLLFLLGILAFALSPWFATSFAALLFGGLGVAGFAAMQSTLILTAVPHEVRGRLMGVLAMSIGTMPLGILHVGLMADWFGPRIALAAMTIEGMAALLAVAVLWRRGRW
jgi:MFS family permease